MPTTDPTPALFAICPDDAGRVVTVRLAVGRLAPLSRDATDAVGRAIEADVHPWASRGYAVRYRQDLV